ncbi:MAG: hypothetical protein JW969_07030 [Spirochaetales bacterium]|nr:hypothetical protein [Spirochaetales bacterium]
MSRNAGHTPALVFFIALYLMAFTTADVSAESGSPRLFQLNWGVSPNTIDEMLESKEFQFRRIIYVPSSRGMDETVIQEDERIDLENEAVLIYYTEGVAYFNIPTRVYLSFYNPDKEKNRLRLYKAEIQLGSKDKKGNPVNLRTLFRDLLFVFFKKYDIKIDAVEESRIFRNNAYSTVLFDVTITFSLDYAKDALIVAYENTQYKELIEAKMAALNIDRASTVVSETEGSGLKVLVDVGVSPFVYNTFDNAYGDSIKVNSVCGMQWDKWLLGGMVYYDYASFDGFDASSTFHGAWGILGAAFHASVDISGWFAVEGGAGASWYASSFQYGGLGLEHRDSMSALVYCTPVFKLGERFSVKTPVRLQLYFGGNGIEPNVYLAGRAEYAPFNDWLGFYGEIGFQPWYYSGSLFNTVSGLFVFSFGSIIDIPFVSEKKEGEVTTG